jgi:hypothetical protein
LCGENTPSQRLREVCTCTSVYPDAFKVQYSVNIHEKHAHSLKRKPGKNACWQGRQLVSAQIKSPESRRNRELGRQLSEKQSSNMNTHTHTHTHTQYVCLPGFRLSDCLRSESESASHAHARVHACAHRSSTASQGCASVHYVCQCVCCYYFANPSTVSVCLSVPVIYTHTYTL